MNYKRILTKNHMKYFEIADNVFAAISPNRGLSYADAAFINRGKGLMYDTCFDLPHARELKKTFVEIAGHEPAYVVNSHFNGDHTWGNQVFSGSTIIMHKAALEEHLGEDPKKYDWIIKHGQEGTAGTKWLSSSMKGFDLAGIEWQDPDILVEGSTTIMLGSTEVQILSIAPAHSMSDLLLWMPKEKILFCGDLIFERGGLMAHSAEGIKLWAKGLDFVANELKPEIIVPGHGAICGVEEAQRNKRYFEDVMEQFDRYYTADITALELAKKIDIKPYMNWLEPERLITIVNALIKGRRNITAPVDWDILTIDMAQYREFLETNYTIPEWDPMYTWAE